MRDVDRTPLLRGLSTAAVMLATIMQIIDTTIANVALPHMQGSLSATQDQISWVLTSYIIAAAVMTPPTGWLALRFGRKRLFLVTVAGFTLASMWCGVAHSLAEMVVARVLQGVFGAALVPLSQATMLDTYPRERHGQAMAIFGMGVMLGPILGPTLGGWLTEYYSWRWVFYINVPFGALALAGIAVFVQETKRQPDRKLDLFGFATLSLALGSFQLLLDRGELLDWFSSTEIVIEAALAALASYLFLVHTLTVERSFIDRTLFADRNFVTGIVCMFVLGIVLLATMALLPPFLQNLGAYPVLTTGIVLAPRGVGTLCAMMLVGRLVARVDPRWLLTFGLATIALSMWEMTFFTADVSAWEITRTGFTQGFGLGFTFVPLTTIAFASLAPHHRTEAASLFSLMRNVGSSVGIAVVTLLLSRHTQVNHAQLAERITPFDPVYRAPWLPEGWSLTDPAGLAAMNQAVTREAMTIAYLNDFRLILYVVLAIMPLVPLLRRPPPVRR